VSGEQVSALTIKHARIVHDWFQEKRIGAPLLDEKGVSVDVVRFADVPAFVILKAIALNQREENKDAADLIHVVRYAGSLEHVAGLFIARIRSGQHPEAIDAGLAALKNQFGDDEFAEGYEKVGAVAYAQFHGGDDDEIVGSQRYAAGLIQGLLAEIEAQLDKVS